MRIVSDASHDTGSCLELPARGKGHEPTVPVECNSGAERATVPRTWEEIPDPEFARRSLAALGR
jgi:hypothetical protein